MKRRGFTLIEVLVAMALLGYATLAFYSVYVTTTKQEIHSQFLALATLTGDSLLEEVKAHRYGMPAPKSWGLDGDSSQWQTLSYDIWIDGKKVQTEFHVQWHLKNGAFVGNGGGQSQDEVTIVISWSEGVGENPDYGDFSKVFYEGDDRHIVVQVPVWK